MLLSFDINLGIKKSLLDKILNIKFSIYDFFGYKENIG